MAATDRPGTPATAAVLGDPGRLAALRRAGIDDGEPSAVLDWLTRLTTRLLQTPVALVTLVDRDRQVFRSAVGLDLPQTPLSHSFCQHVVEGDAALVVPDAHEHPLVAGNLAIENLGVVAYAGVPLVDRDGFALGSFCAIDHEPREWRPEDVELLSGLAAVAVAELERRSAVTDLAARERELRRERALLGHVVAGLGAAAAVADPDGHITRVVGDSAAAWGVPAASLPGRLAGAALPGLPGEDAMRRLRSGERPSGVHGGGWSLLPVHDEDGTPAEVAIVRAPGGGRVTAPETPPAPRPHAPAAVLAWAGLPLDDAAGIPVGRIDGVLAGPATDPWLLVRLPGGRHVLAPVAGAVAGAGRVTAAWPAERIVESPDVAPGPVAPADAGRVAAHYGNEQSPGALALLLHEVS